LPRNISRHLLARTTDAACGLSPQNGVAALS
jgi:hypothetical protein